MGRLGSNWSVLFDDLVTELALIIGHMKRTVAFSADQVDRLRSGDLS